MSDDRYSLISNHLSIIVEGVQKMSTSSELCALDWVGIVSPHVPRSIPLLVRIVEEESSVNIESFALVLGW